MFSLKILYPQKVFLVRGNHEDRVMNQNYGFLQDCQKRFGFKLGDFPDSEQLYENVFSIPIYPNLKKTEQVKIINLIKLFFHKHA